MVAMILVILKQLNDGNTVLINLLENFMRLSSLTKVSLPTKEHLFIATWLLN